jgi:UDP:flavonoid glycosyltransferase YjiC (YdhE family)
MHKLTVLFTWEIGQGFGHVMPLLPVARELKAGGHRVVFAVRDAKGAGTLLKSEGFVVVQAPAHPDQFFPAKGPQPQTMADILQVFGFTSRQSLSGLMAAWQGLFDLCKPDVVIASYAPLSLLCARHAAIPTILMALPFELPAAVHPSPPLRIGAPMPDGKVDEKIIQTVNAAFSENLVESVHGIFRATKVFLMSFPELDPFGPRENAEYCGNLFVTDVGRAPVWPESSGSHRVFAYLNASLPNLAELRKKIHASPHAYCIFLRGADESMLRDWQSPNAVVESEAVCLTQAFRECDAVLSYGGPGFISASLLAGKPMVFYVRNLEPYLSARQVAKLGAGILPTPQSPSALMASLDQILSHKSFTEAAQSFARKHKQHSVQEAASRIVDVALRISNM